MSRIPHVPPEPVASLPAGRAVPGPGEGPVALGRKPVISREDIITAALRLVGSQRSISSLSLREVAREAGIAPNSFYRQFRDMDELAVALIDRAGESLRQIIGEARHRAVSDRSVVRSSIEVFMDRLRDEDKLLHILLREGSVGSDAFRQAVDRQLTFFEEELKLDLIRLAEANGTGLFAPAVTARAITRLVFALGAKAVDMAPPQREALTDELTLMVRMIVLGTQALASQDGAADAARR